MLKDSDIDAVGVLTGVTFKPKVCIDTLHAGKHVFVEKPLALTISDAEDVLEAQRKSNRILEVGYMKRYDPGYNIAIEEFNKMEDIRLIRMHNIGSHHRERGEVCPKLFFPLREEVRKKSREESQRLIKKQLGPDTTSVEATAYGRLLIPMCSHDINAVRGIFGNPRRVLSTEIRAGGLILTSLLDYGDYVCVWECGRSNHKWWDEEIFAYSPEKNVGVIFPSPFLKNASKKKLIMNLKLLDSRTEFFLGGDRDDVFVHKKTKHSIRNGY